MPTINFKTREVSCKIVYYGPSLSGKTTNICFIHQSAPEANRSRLQCVETRGDRTLFFDHFSLDLGRIGAMTTRFQIYGVPGQAYYRTTRKMVLGSVDGIVFVADSDRARLGDNLESLEDMRQLMAEHGYDAASTPMVIQYNKRDLPDALEPRELERMLNTRQCPWFEAVATEGKGVIETFKAICTTIIAKINQETSPNQGQRAMSPGAVRPI
ncbi:MAG: GTPase domain-containing protein [Candidatus Sumerlaeota bacterium]|nr:GTPase domain-containing protein [Candidatus Sumerlaeota bacterium]